MFYYSNYKPSGNVHENQIRPGVSEWLQFGDKFCKNYFLSNKHYF